METNRPGPFPMPFWSEGSIASFASGGLPWALLVAFQSALRRLIAVALTTMRLPLCRPACERTSIRPTSMTNGQAPGEGTAILSAASHHTPKHAEKDDQARYGIAVEKKASVSLLDLRCARHRGVDLSGSGWDSSRMGDDRRVCPSLSQLFVVTVD